MWKCKKCGKTKFRIDGTITIKNTLVDLDDDGDIGSFNDIRGHISHQSIDSYACTRCGKYSSLISDIADWVKGD